MTNTTTTRNRELEFGKLGTSVGVDSDASDSDTVAYLELADRGTMSQNPVQIIADLYPEEARSVIKALQTTLELNNERNAVGYPIQVLPNEGSGRGQFACPACDELLPLETTTQCSECGAQIELRACVTAEGSNPLDE